MSWFRLASALCVPTLCLLIISGPRGHADDPAPSSPHEQSQTESVGQATGPTLFYRCAGWGVLGLFGAGGLGAYLRRRPTAICVVGIWCYSAYHVYSSWVLGLSVVPPLLAIAISGLFAPIARVANDEAVQEGRRRETPYTFSSGSTLSMAFVYISLGAMVTMWAGWTAWDVIPGFRECPLTRKLTVGIMITSVGLCLMMWIDTLAHAGPRSLKLVPVMATLFPRCRRGRYLIVLAGFCVAVWHQTFFSDLSPLRWEMTFSLLFVVAMLWLQPPYVLFLGASSNETGKALGRLATASFPFRTVASLDRNRTGYTFSSFSWWTDDLRTWSERDWRWVIDRLIDAMPAIVVDTRTSGPAVDEEVRQLLRNERRLQRSTFIAFSDGSAPMLISNGVPFPYAGMRVITETDIDTMLSFSALSKRKP